MYMGAIVRAKAPASTTKRRLVGTAMLLGGIVVMVPYLALQAAFAGAVLGAKGIVGMVDYAGDVALGR